MSSSVAGWFAIRATIVLLVALGSVHGGAPTAVFGAVGAAGAVPQADCPLAITRHPGTTRYSGTVTQHAGGKTCVVRLPDGVTLVASGGTARQVVGARSVFRISGTGIDTPGLSISVSASPVPTTSVPELDPLNADAILILPRDALLVRYDTPTGRFVSVPNGHLREWALYKVIRRGAFPVDQPAPAHLPRQLPATGRGGVPLGLGAGLVAPSLLAWIIALLTVVAAGFAVRRWHPRYGVGVRPRATPAAGTLAVACVVVIGAAGVTGMVVKTTSSGNGLLATVGFGSLTDQGTAIGSGSAPALAMRLVIPRLAVDTPVIALQVANDAWQVPSYSAGYLAGSAPPGGQGNLSIAGHDDQDGSVFRRLADARRGDLVQVYGRDNHRVYHYIVTALGTVPPSDTSVVAPTRGAMLTLITCTPYGIDTQRLIVRARLVG